MYIHIIHIIHMYDVYACYMSEQIINSLFRAVEDCQKTGLCTMCRTCKSSVPVHTHVSQLCSCLYSPFTGNALTTPPGSVHFSMKLMDISQ